MVYIKKKVRLVIIKRSITEISKIEKTIKDSAWTRISFSTCVRIIDKIAAAKESMVDDTMETKVSLTTLFSILLELSILLMRTDENPNKTVKTMEKTVVKSPARLVSIDMSNL